MPAYKIIKYTNIMDEGWEYLIAVAEKIIKKCADLQTQEKYFMIK